MMSMIENNSQAKKWIKDINKMRKLSDYNYPVLTKLFMMHSVYHENTYDEFI